MLGTNADEGAFNLIGFLKGITDLDEVETRWDELGPLILFTRSIDERSLKDVELARKVKQFYFGSEKIGWETVQKFIKMMGDHMFYSGVERIIR